MSNEEITRAQEVETKANTIVGQIAPMTRMACGWRNASYVDGLTRSNAGDVQVTATVLRGKSHFIRITLCWNDTYRVERLRIPTRRAKDQTIRIEECHDGVMCWNLSEVVYGCCNK